MSKRIRIAVLALLLLMGGSFIGLSHLSGADAGPAHGETIYRAAAIDENSTVRHVTLLEQGVKTMPGTTPVSGDTVCLDGDMDLYAARLTLVGTIGAGTAPVLTVVLQSSDDGGVTWMNVGSSFAAINSTVTPAGGVERVTFADSALGAVNTPVAYGNCFRVRMTWAGSAATTVANVGVTLYGE